jgi:hypothetical protein
VAAVEDGPPDAACVAVMVWLALLSAEVGVKLHAPLATVAVPATVPSIDTVTVSPVTPPPEMVGVAVVVSVLPLAGLVIVGAAGAGPLCLGILRSPPYARVLTAAAFARDLLSRNRRTASS